MRIPGILASALVFAATMTAVTAVASAQKTPVAQLEVMAKTAQAAIAASKADMKAMQSAIAARSVSQAKTVLERHGFTAAQLAEGVIMFNHALLPKKAQSGQYYYMEIDGSPFKLTVHALP